MNVSDSLSAARFSAALSSLSTANKQPQLALDLILQSVAGLQTAGAAQTLATEAGDRSVQPPAEATSGQIIDIVA